MIAALLYLWLVMMNREEQIRFAQLMDVATQHDEEYLVEVRDHVLVGWVGLT